MTPETGLAELIRAITAIVTLGFAAPGIVLIVNAIKVLRPGWNPQYVHLAIQVIVWAVYQIATHAGLGVQFEQWWQAGITIIGVLLPLFTSVVAGQKTYDYSARNNIALWGYQRTENNATYKKAA